MHSTFHYRFGGYLISVRLINSGDLLTVSNFHAAMYMYQMVSVFALIAN